MKLEFEHLPKNWEIKKLGEATTIIMGQSPPSDTYNSEKIGLPFFQGKAEFTDISPIAVKWCSSPKKIAIPNDILLSVRAPVGATNVADVECSIGRGLAIVRFDNWKYLFYFLRSIEKQLDNKGTGTTFKAISGEVLRETPFPIPPLSEQQSIVQKIEELFSELDKSIENLKTAQQQIKTYRQSVLKSAFEGKLTSKKEDENLMMVAEPNLEYGKYKLPAGWKWNFIGDLTISFDGKRIPLSKEVRAKRKGNFRYYGATTIVDYIDDFIFDGKYILIGEDGANLLSKSKPLSFIVEGKFWVNNHAHILQTKEILNLEYFNYYFNSLNLNEFITGTAQPKLTQNNLKKIKIPFPELFEQIEIVNELDSRFSVADKLEESINQSLLQAETLRQSILKRAFEGKLI